MSYHIYTTDGLVLLERPWREADRIYNILTRDLGLIRATALGVRKEASKLRGSLEPISLASISLVRGKEYWRVTSAQSLKRLSPKPSLLKPLALLDKLVQGEASHPELFDAVEKMILKPNTDEEVTEINLVAQILYHLGYLKESDLSLEKRELLKAINDGIQASNLTS